MANTYTWVIEALDAHPSENGQTDVVFNAHWRMNGTDGTHNATVYGTVGIIYDPATTFTPFASLTQAQVIGWVQNALGAEKVSELQANLDSQIANLVNPTVITPALPWSA